MAPFPSWSLILLGERHLHSAHSLLNSWGSDLVHSLSILQIPVLLRTKLSLHPSAGEQLLPLEDPPTSPLPPPPEPPSFSESFTPTLAPEASVSQAPSHSTPDQVSEDSTSLCGVLPFARIVLAPAIPSLVLTVSRAHRILCCHGCLALSPIRGGTSRPGFCSYVSKSPTHHTEHRTQWMLQAD